MFSNKIGGGEWPSHYPKNITSLCYVQALKRTTKLWRSLCYVQVSYVFHGKG